MEKARRLRSDLTRHCSQDFTHSSEGGLRYFKACRRREKIAVPADASIDASIDIRPIPAGFGIAARLAISLPNMNSALGRST